MGILIVCMDQISLKAFIYKNLNMYELSNQIQYKIDFFLKKKRNFISTWSPYDLILDIHSYKISVMKMRVAVKKIS